ncbi:MAG: ABC transporter permease [Hyphomicrobiales bacterium]|nr:ABC transporter permease [Hyphomicrobiales bacterium]
MRGFWLATRLDISESLRARWFVLYSLVFGGIIVILFMFGLTESRVMGFTGLTRLLVTYIQISMAVLPIFILITTVRSLAGDREAGVYEYMLSQPISLSAWYWGRFAGRLVAVFVPVFLAMAIAVFWGVIRGAETPVYHFLWYSVLLLSLSFCFLGIGFLISSLTRSSDVAQSAAFFVWLILLLFLDLILLGLIIRAQSPPGLVISLALANPLQVFRTATMMLFDPQLIMLGPSAWLILDNFGHFGYLAWALIYPFVLGLMFGGLGYLVFRRGDLP